MKVQFHVVMNTSCITFVTSKEGKIKPYFSQWFWPRCNTNSLHLARKTAGGRGGGVTLNVSNNYHPSRFLSWMAQFSVYAVTKDLLNAKKPCWKETSAHRIKSQNKFQETLTSAKRSGVTLATATKLSEKKKTLKEVINNTAIQKKARMDKLEKDWNGLQLWFLKTILV